ncbi:protease propeptide/inhibitor [Coprinellus micaceus]|uniref:Protease propeptide/inhibitor n=1 Tax=Coprinellus micaceus TaxID=71717 RepID=A0A4Y7SV03_COPMI|nr:protease propeptide/inhibitor [Coprinellus micaceus]TEB26887.1 protease propeptide/inhibitor [Coprinellus micaceus]
MSDSGKFIVVFKDHVTSEQISKYAAEVKAAGGEIKDRYDEGAGILNGFSATIPSSFKASLAGDDLVSYIEPDGVVTIQ